MKTKYIKPNILVIKVKTEAMICASTDGLSTTLSDEFIESNSSVLSRKRYSLWDEEYDEEY